MKKKEIYLAPQVQVVGLKLDGMLCQSQPQGQTGEEGVWEEGGW